MELMVEVYDTLKKKPFLWFVLCFLVLPYCVIEYMVLFPLLYAAYSIGVGNVYELTISLIQFILIGIKKVNFVMHPNIIGLSTTILTLFIFSIIMSFYFYMVNAFVNNRNINIFFCTKKYVLQILRIIVLFVIVVLLFMIVGLIISLPALLLTGSVADKASYGLVSFGSLMIIDVTTVVVLFFEMTIIITFFSVWIGCIYSFDRGSFYKAITIFKEFFWGLIQSGMYMMIILIAIELIFASLSIWVNKRDFGEWVGIFLLVFMNSLAKSLVVVFYSVFVFIDLKYKKKISLNY